MDVRFVYSLILIISMMFLCLMTPPDSKQKSQEKENITRMDLKSQLIINLLYPKIIAKIREERAVTPLKVNSEEIDLLHIEPNISRYNTCIAGFVNDIEMLFFQCIFQ